VPVPSAHHAVERAATGGVYFTCELGNRERAAVVAVGKAAREANVMSQRGVVVQRTNARARQPHQRAAVVEMRRRARVLMVVPEAMAPCMGV
jgi:hypothetical protein